MAVTYFKRPIKALGHTPIYKMHKYFARRPHNVFNALIREYSEPKSIIWDPFGGGGVTLVEGLTEDRRVIISDVNPIASYIQKVQVSDVDQSRLSYIEKVISQRVSDALKVFYETECTNCDSETAHVRWFEHAYVVECPSCKLDTCLDNQSKATNDSGKVRNGIYVCKHCAASFRSVDVKRKSSQILNIRFTCKNCNTQDTKNPSVRDINKFQTLEQDFLALSEQYALNNYDQEIPEEWDRQHEDCLHRKGFNYFSDLFTKRNLLTCNFLFTELERSRNRLTEEEFELAGLLLSSLIRYTNNMTFSTSSWMDGRPVAWAKHAFWTPNQFIETNPFEYLLNRLKAFRSAIKDRKSRFENKTIAVSLNQLFEGVGDYIIKCDDSSKLPIPENSVDLVLTDPPYGSNVQYGELSSFWMTWLNDINPFSIQDRSLTREAVVHRRTKSSHYSKDFSNYYELLVDVFKSCHIALKHGGRLCYTFNNKDIRAWYAVIKATIDAGFYIEPDGVFYQEGIEAYRDTAHLRYDGTPQGDFIYTFLKSDKAIDFSKVTDSFDDVMNLTLSDFETLKTTFRTVEFYIALFSRATLCLIKQISEGKDESEINREFAYENIEKFLTSKKGLYRIGNNWSFKSQR